MKKSLVLLLALMCIVAFYAFKTLEASEEALKKIGVPGPVAKDLIWFSFSGKYLAHPSGTKLPTPMAEQLKEQKEQMKKSIKETEDAIESMPAEQREGMKGVVASLKEQLKSYDDPNNPMLSPEMDRMIKQTYDAEMVEYKTKLTAWEKENPLTPKMMITGWLTEFLEISKDVDFKAELITNEDGKKLFAKTEYERKPDSWKMCFRAGKETVEAGRSFATQWLDELKKGK